MSNQLAIIIPAYKATFFKKTLSSIASQTCKDFTLYIGDDCSPYDLESIVNEYKNSIDIEYKRFETNLGGANLVSHWERCIDMSRNEPYLWLFSDDDVMEPHCVEMFYKLPVEIRDNYLIHFNIDVINEQSKGIIESVPKYPNLLSGIDFLKKKVSGEIVSFVIEYVFSRNLFVKNGRFLNYDLAWGSDILTWFKLANHCHGIYTIESPNAHVRWRKSDYNISPNVSSQIVLRKMYSIVENAAFVQDELMRINGHRDFFIHSKAVWGDIKRHSCYMSYSNVLKTYCNFVKKVGFPFFSTISLLVVLTTKFFRLYGNNKDSFLL